MSIRIDRILCAGLILAATAASGLAQNPSAPGRTEVQAQKLAERIAQMKADPNNPYFAVSELPLAEQHAFAVKQIEAIKKLTAGESPDPSKIIDLCLEVLRRAPASPQARMAHWNIPAYFLMIDKREDAQAALESYLAKYNVPESQKLDAYDKLAVIAQKKDDWGLALYYADRYLALSPSSPSMRLVMVRGLIKQGDTAEGEKLLQRIIAEAPGTDQAVLAQRDLNALRSKSQPPGLVAEYKESLDRLRRLVMTIEDFRIIKGKLPATLSELSPEFLSEPIDTDAWGKKWIVEIDLKANTYRIASAGSDGFFSGFGQKGEYSVLKGRDIIFADGAPVLIPAVDD